MLLLIDLGDFLFSYYIKHGRLTDKQAVDAFVDIYKKLAVIPSNILNKIRSIIFMNSAGYLLEINEDIYPKSVKLMSEKIKLNHFLSKVFNQELRIYILDLVTPDDHFVLINDLQQPNIEKMGICFFNTLLTNSMAKFLIRCSNVLGYRKIRSGNKFIWEKIANVGKYLNIITILYQKFIGQNAVRENYYEISESAEPRFIQDLKNFKQYKYYNIHVIKIDKHNKEKVNYLIDMLKTELGDFHFHYCKDMGKNIPLVERLIIMDLEDLTGTEQRKILSDISSDKYDDSLILIFVENQIDIRNYPKVNPRVELSYADKKKLNELSLKTIENKIKEFDEKVDNYRNILSRLDIAKEQKDHILKDIEKFSSGGNLFNSEAVDFWYDKDILELKNSEVIRRTNKEWEKIFYESKHTYYEINLDKETDMWLIKINGTALKPINFRYKPLKCLVYLYEHYSDGKKLSYDKLEEVLNNWGKNKKVDLSQISPSRVADNKYRLLKDYPGFEAIREYLKLGSKESGCYYIKNDEVVIELGNFEIPDAV